MNLFYSICHCGLYTLIGILLVFSIHCDQSPVAQVERYISVYLKPYNTTDLDSSDTYELYQLYFSKIKYTGETKADSTGKIYAVTDTVWEYRIIDSIYNPNFSKTIQIVDGHSLAFLHCIGGKMGELIRTRKSELKNLIDDGPSGSSSAFINELKDYGIIYDGKLHLRYYDYPTGNIGYHGSFKVLKKSPKDNDTITYMLSTGSLINSTSSSSYYK